MLPSVMMCFLFDDKSTLSEPLDGLECMASQRAHTRGLIKIDTVRWTEENRKGFINIVVLQVSTCSQEHLISRINWKGPSQS